MPYLMSSHPGSTLHEAIELALFLKKLKDTSAAGAGFNPTPGTISTVHVSYRFGSVHQLQSVYVPKISRRKENAARFAAIL